jgi:hypothetical protein
MATADEVLRLRRLLGETIPSGGTEADTLFTDAELTQLIDDNPDMDRAAYEGWREKAASLSGLVDTTEGNAQRKMSQLLTHAQDMVKMYLRSSGGPTEGRTRIGRIVRSEEAPSG